MTDPETKSWFLVLAIGPTNVGGTAFTTVEAVNPAKAALGSGFRADDYDILMVFELGQSDGSPVLTAEALNMPTWMLRDSDEEVRL